MAIKQIVGRSIADNSITGAKVNTTALTTSNVSEGNNLYYTDARAYANTALLNYITGASLSGYATNSQLSSYATTTFVNNELANLVSSAPAALDTLNELAAALGDDPNFATSTATLIGTAYGQANTAYTVATSAYSAANTKVATVAGVTSTSISNTNLLDGIKTVDGSGSGLDADTLDGVQAASFAQLTSPTFSGSLTTTSGTGRVSLGTDAGGSISLGNTSSAGASSPYIDFNPGATTVDYDVRIQAQGGIGTAAKGQLYVYARDMSLVNSNLAVDTNVLYVDSVNNRVGIGTTSPGTTFAMGANTLISVNSSALQRVDLGSRSSNTTINVAMSSYFTATATGNFTFAFSDAASGTLSQIFALELTNGGDYTVGWPTSVKWPSDTAPTLTSGGTDVLIFLTDNNGTTWRGSSILAYTT